MSQRPGLVGGQSYSRSVENGTRPSAHPPACLLGFQTACLVSLCHLAFCAHAASHNKRYKAGRASIFGWSAFTMSIRLTGTGDTCTSSSLQGLPCYGPKVAEIFGTALRDRRASPRCCGQSRFPCIASNASQTLELIG